MCVDINTHRQAANECVNVLAQNYIDFCYIAAQHIEVLLHRENRQNSMRTALFLVPLVQSIDIDAFCVQYVIPILKDGHDLAVKCDAIKLILKFGSMLINNLLLSCLKQLKCYRNNGSVNSVVAKYASWTLEKWTKMFRPNPLPNETDTRKTVESVLKSVLRSQPPPRRYLSKLSFSDLNM